MENRKEYRFTIGLFIAYLILLIWIILFKLQTDFFQLDYLRSINLMPFAASLTVNGKIAFGEIFYNLLAFVPLGVYLCMLKPKWSWLSVTAVCFFTSLCFEILQFIFAIGASDMTDLLANTCGGILGIGLFGGMQKLWRENTQKVINGLFCVATVLLVALLLVLILVNL